MSQTTANTSAFIEAQVYSSFILANLNDGLLPGAVDADARLHRPDVGGQVR